MSRRVPAGLLPVLLATGCGGGVVTVAGPPPPPPGLAALALEVAPKDVEVTLDDAFAGRLDGYRDGLLAVTPGPHRLMLSRRGCLPGYFDVDVPPAGGRLVTHLVCLDEGERR
ncbi:hypothetical protein L6V77_09745 [Myxococcota bacterium]|nr:hypothetical protein [Myxococcota bacterium]